MNIALWVIHIAFVSMGIFSAYYCQGPDKIAMIAMAAAGLSSSIYFAFTIDRTLQSRDQLISRLQNAQRNKELLYSLAIHDLRGPAQHLALLTQLINEDHVKVDEYRMLSKQIHGSAKRHFDLVNKLVEWTKLEVTSQEDICDLYPIVQEICSNNKAKCDAKEIILLNYIDKPFPVAASRALLEAVIGNIVHNSVKFTPGGGIITVSAERTMDGMQVIVNDTGLGMTEEQAEKLFYPGRKHIARGTMNEQGSGIGLILCNELVKKAGGTINVKSKPGKGSTFTFSLPTKASIYRQKTAQGHFHLQQLFRRSVK